MEFLIFLIFPLWLFLALSTVSTGTKSTVSTEVNSNAKQIVAGVVFLSFLISVVGLGIVGLTYDFERDTVLVNKSELKKLTDNEDYFEKEGKEIHIVVQTEKGEQVRTLSQNDVYILYEDISHEESSLEEYILEPSSSLVKYIYGNFFLKMKRDSREYIIRIPK